MSIILIVVISLCLFHKLDKNNYKTHHRPIYCSTIVEGNLKDVQCPIPKENRVFNKTGTQCVWASIEMLGRWAEEPKLINPPLTRRKECQTFSSPANAAYMLDKLQVKYEQSYRNKTQAKMLIKKAMAEKRGCLWGITGHAMVLVHYDEQNNIMKWVDNNDMNLNVQTASLDKFQDIWDSWVLVIYADKDVIYNKVREKSLFDIYDIKQDQYWKEELEFPSNHGITIPGLNIDK